MKSNLTQLPAIVFMTAVLLLFSQPVLSQTNVRAWYAEGQVWVIWETGSPLPDWYGVYANTGAFSSTDDAFFLGRPLKLEYLCAALKEQIDTTFTPRIPGPAGMGKYQLAENEGLFVFTPHQAGSLFFAVVADHETVVNTGQNITASSVPFQYNPATDPVECHLQATFPSPFASGYGCFAFMMWADGRQNQWENRPDFPVMANLAKNGMPSLFMVSAPIGLDTAQPFPLSIWLHGGGGTARQSLAGSRAEVNIKPVEGLLVSHNDDVFGWRGMSPPGLENPTWHFGYRKNYDPFNSDNIPSIPDTIVNYTQRRYLWVDQWLMRYFNIDPDRIHIYGHSMGSAGALALAKCYPEHYASATLFNTGCGGPEPGSMLAHFGDVSQNFPTNLKNRAGETVHQLNLWNLLDNCSPERDWPLIRHWHSKNDDNGTMRWDAYVIENYHKADSLGLGVQNMWSERDHGMDTGPAYNDHWISGVPPNQQTAVDNVAFAEARFHRDQSLPAFFNHRLDPNAHDPGTGLIGINNGDGDNWGAWGGYHRWDDAGAIEQPSAWSIIAWLESNAIFANDNCPHNSLKADLAIRRPQIFKPSTGKVLNWSVKETGTGNILQSGTTVVQADDLVVIPQVTVFKENIRRVRITISDPSVSVIDPEAIFSGMKILPNPISGYAALVFEHDNNEVVEVKITPLTGDCQIQKIAAFQGENRVMLDMTRFQSGLYFVSLASAKGVRTKRVVVAQ